MKGKLIKASNIFKPSSSTFGRVFAIVALERKGLFPEEGLIRLKYQHYHFKRHERTTVVLFQQKCEMSKWEI
jgi:hypothetical protein